MKHCVLAKFNRSVDKDMKKRFMPEIEKIFTKLLVVDGIHGVEVIENVIDRPNRYDVLIRIDMDKDVLPVYDESEPHKEWKKEFGALLESKAIFDYE